MPITPLKQVQCIRPKREPFDFKEWDSQVIDNTDELRKKINQFNLIGKVIKDIRLSSLVYNFSPDSIEETVYCKTEGYPEKLHHYVSEFEHIDDYFPIPLSLEMDDPVLIQFTDGTQFEILTFFENSFVITLNQLPWNVKGKVGIENINGSILLEEYMGAKIMNAEVISHYDNECGKIIDAISLTCHQEENKFSIVFSESYTYMFMQFFDTFDKEVLHCPFLQIKRSMYADETISS